MRHMVKNEVAEQVMAELDRLINIPIPRSMIGVIKQFTEIVAMLQGEIEGLIESHTDLMVKVQLLEKGIRMKRSTGEEQPWQVESDASE